MTQLPHSAVVEALANPRDRMEGIHAIYLFAPNERAVNLILQVRVEAHSGRWAALTHPAFAPVSPTQDFRVEEGRVVPKTCCEKIMYYGLKPATATVALYDHVHLVFTRGAGRRHKGAPRARR